MYRIEFNMTGPPHPAVWKHLRIEDGMVAPDHTTREAAETWIKDRAAKTGCDISEYRVVEVPGPAPAAGLPVDSTERKNVPICSGCIDYAPAAIEQLIDLLRHPEDYTNGGRRATWTSACDPRFDSAIAFLARRDCILLAVVCLDLLAVDLGCPSDSTDAAVRWGLAFAEVSKISKAGNDKHNPGQPMHHARWKSTDHEDCIARHLVDLAREPGGTDGGMRHSACLAWRALMLLQRELEAAGAPLARAAKVAEGAAIGEPLPV